MAVNEEMLTAEDLALKQALSGLTVMSPRARAGGASSGTTTVSVWFRWPSREFANPPDSQFPFITLDLFDVNFESNRAHSYNYDEMAYLPDDTPASTTNPQTYIAPYPDPLSLIYVVATHCRYAQHDRELFRKLLQPNYLPWRFGSLYVPQDDTVRRLDVIDIQQTNDFDSLKKRVYRRIWTIAISAEMLPENWTAPSPPITTPITEVDLTVTQSN